MSLSNLFTEKAEQLKPTNTTLPTMYDLPSEDPEEPGLPDEFHDLQPQLLSATLRLTDVKSDQIFTGTDLNLYYDAEHKWYKRPDWFVAIGVPRLYDEHDMRMSYVVWDEGVSPSVIVELLSEGTDKEDLGLTKDELGKAPTKWTVYEQILKVPYYIVYDRHKDILRAYRLTNERYQAIEIEGEQIWISELKAGLGLWQGEYQGITRKWLRWLDTDGNWIPTPEENLVEAEAKVAQLKQSEEKAARLAQRLRQLGVDPDEV
jgi:Uma2 family endonuclease